jgi:Family of unknown function (DUF5706)
MEAVEQQLESIEEDLLSDTFVDFERSVLQDNIALFDTKAAAVLAFSGVMVLYSIDSIATFHAAGPHARLVTAVVRALFAVAAAGFLLSAVFSLSTVRPRVARGAEGHVFWDSAVYRLPIADYLKAMKGLDPSQAREEKLRHLHLLAGICRNKIRDFRTSLFVAEGAFIALVAAELARLTP